MKYLSICSGIEAATVAWHPLGWEPLAFSEIEPFPRALLAHHYPGVPCHGDFTVLREQDWIVDADVLVGGTPCQAFSVAGLRQSLNDDRGNLTLEFVRLADAIDNLRYARGREPSIIVWENVPGVLSVSDNAFGCFLAAIVGNDTALIPTGGRWTNAGMVIGPKRAAAWRILDAQYFGVAQRRRRVFVVASARDGFDPAEVLLERNGVRRDTAPRRGTGQEITGTLEASIGTSRGAGTPTSILNAEENIFSASSIGAYKKGIGTLRANGGDNGGGSENLVAGTMISHNGGGGWSNSIDKATAGYMVPVTFSAPEIGHIIEDAVSGAITKHTGGGGETQNPAFVLDAKYADPIAFHPTQTPISSDDGATHALGCGSYNGQASIAVAMGFYSNEGSHGSGDNTEVSVTLKAAKTSNLAAVAFPINTQLGLRGETSNSSREGLGIGNDGDPAFTLQANHGHAVAIGAFFAGQGAKAGSIAYDEDVAPTLKASDSGTNRTPSAHIGMAVRRLTPRECERLQGFPNDYTLIPMRGKEAADGPRYKALGNSMAVPVMHWIGKRIDKLI